MPGVTVRTETWRLYQEALQAIQHGYDLVAGIVGSELSATPAVPISPAMVREIQIQIQRFQERFALLVAERKREARG